MASAIRDKALVVIQLSGGNDCLNTVVPYTNDLYYDFRPTVHIAPEDVLPLNDAIGLNPSMGPVKRLWDEGKVAIINGIGYPHPDRSHFRSMDIWHTAEPEKIGKEGWLGRAIRELDPTGDNVLTGVNFGRGLPRALGCRGVPVASVGNLETYGLFSDMQDKQAQQVALETFTRMYGGAAGRDDVMLFIFSEFGRRIRDNGSGTDHGSGGVAFVIGKAVQGGMYGEYPSLRVEDQLHGDLRFNNDFRCTYATLLEQWLGLESAPIVNGQFEQFACLRTSAS